MASDLVHPSLSKLCPLLMKLSVQITQSESRLRDSINVIHKKYQTVRTVAIFNRQIVEREANSTTVTHIYMAAYFHGLVQALH